MKAIDVTKENFEANVKEGIVLLDFWAPWCGPCKTFKPIFEAEAEKHADVVFGKINTEQEMELAQSFNIRSIPTLMVIRDGINLYQEAGALPPQALKELVQKVKELDMDKIRAEIAKQS